MLSYAPLIYKTNNTYSLFQVYPCGFKLPMTKTPHRIISLPFQVKVLNIAVSPLSR